MKADVKDNNININNPNISVPSQALANVGIGAAVGAGMNAGVNLIKGSALPVGVKIGTVVAAGAVGGLTTVAVNAINSLTQNKINSNNQNASSSNQDASSSNQDTSSSGGPFTSGSSMIDDNNFNNVMDLFYSNLGLQIIIIYLSLIHI